MVTSRDRKLIMELGDRVRNPRLGGQSLFQENPVRFYMWVGG